MNRGSRDSVSFSRTSILSAVHLESATGLSMAASLAELQDRLLRFQQHDEEVSPGPSNGVHAAAYQEPIRTLSIRLA